MSLSKLKNKLKLKTKKIQNKIKGVCKMMAMLMAINIVSGDYSWEDVHDALKPAVYKQLVILGAGDLAVGYEPEEDKKG